MDATHTLHLDKDALRALIQSVEYTIVKLHGTKHNQSLYAHCNLIASVANEIWEKSYPNEEIYNIRAR